MDAAYVREVLCDVLRDAVNEVKGEFIARHNVDTNKTSAVVHYTSLQTLFSMLHGSAERSRRRSPADPGADPHPPRRAPTDFGADADPPAKTPSNQELPTDRRYLRLYDCANLNDPLEGAYFLKELVGTQDTLPVLEHVVQVPAYIASFVTPNQNATNGDDNKAGDNLVFWRLYGQEGRGCSISIPVERFTSGQCGATLQKVIYERGNAASHARRLRPVMECLDAIVEAANKNRRRDLERQIAATLLECLGEIPYLYKSSAYSYEEECRIVAMEADLESHGGIRYDFEARPGQCGRLRMYGQHQCLRLTNILATDTVITLGPSIPNVDYVQYAIEQLLKSIGIRDLKIEQSDILYRKT